jgi:hypothetical protein
MLLTREEMTFDFRGARLDPVRDREILAWMMNQFLYGEVTGIQCGHWLYEAPDLDAARFFSRQAVEEFQHVDNFVRILRLLGAEPAPAHPLVRFLSTGMMPGSFEEHVCLEMALGEGLVLMALYGIIDTIDHDEIRSVLERAVKQEERHVEFGERRTMEARGCRRSTRCWRNCRNFCNSPPTAPRRASCAWAFWRSRSRRCRPCPRPSRWPPRTACRRFRSRAASSRGDA